MQLTQDTNLKEKIFGLFVLHVLVAEIIDQTPAAGILVRYPQNISSVVHKYAHG